MTSTLQLHSEPQPVVILGGGLAKAEGTFVLSPRTIERMKTFGDNQSLVRSALADYALCSGGVSRCDHPGGLPRHLREGHQMARWLHETLSFPYAHIEVDDTPENTVENFANAIQGGWLQPNNALPAPVLIQGEYIPRVKLIADALDLRVAPVNVGNQQASSEDSVSLVIHRTHLMGAKGLEQVMAAVPKIRDDMEEALHRSQVA